MARYRGSARSSSWSSDEGDVWVGPAAFLVCMWALGRHREWSLPPERGPSSRRSPSASSSRSPSQRSRDRQALSAGPHAARRGTLPALPRHMRHAARIVEGHEVRSRGRRRASASTAPRSPSSGRRASTARRCATSRPRRRRARRRVLLLSLQGGDRPRVLRAHAREELRAGRGRVREHRRRARTARRCVPREARRPRARPQAPLRCSSGASRTRAPTSPSSARRTIATCATRASLLFDRAIAPAPSRRARRLSARRVLVLALWSLHMGVMLYFIHDTSRGSAEDARARRSHARSPRRGSSPSHRSSRRCSATRSPSSSATQASSPSAMAASPKSPSTIGDPFKRHEVAGLSA